MKQEHTCSAVSGYLMLASAVVAARTQIVDGAVGMVSLDEDKKATMVSNLLVVLCSESHATPVVNASTLYQ